MNTPISQMGSVPMRTAAIASLFPEIKASQQKVRSLEAENKIIRLKRGLYVLSPAISHQDLSTELIANHLYSPSYVSMSSALRYYGLIPEAVYCMQSMTIKHARSFHTPLGTFAYTTISREAFPLGVSSERRSNFAFLIASPEKALCDLIANSSQVNLRYKKDVEHYLFQDIRMETSDVRNLDASFFARYAEVGKKAKSLQTLYQYLRR